MNKKNQINYFESFLNYIKIDAIDTKVDIMGGYSYPNFHEFTPGITMTYFGQTLHIIHKS